MAELNGKPPALSQKILPGGIIDIGQMIFRLRLCRYRIHCTMKKMIFVVDLVVHPDGYTVLSSIWGY